MPTDSAALYSSHVVFDKPQQGTHRAWCCGHTSILYVPDAELASGPLSKRQKILNTRTRTIVRARACMRPQTMLWRLADVTPPSTYRTRRLARLTMALVRKDHPSFSLERMVHNDMATRSSKLEMVFFFLRYVFEAVWSLLCRPAFASFGKPTPAAFYGTKVSR